MNVIDSFWYDDFQVLFKRDRLTEFFPTKDQTLEERLNSIMRLSLYISVLLYFYHKNYKYLSIALGTGLLTIYLYRNSSKDNRNNRNVETLTSDVQACTKPTMDNPFMNVTMKDYMNIVDGKIVDRAPACNITDDTIKKDMDTLFENNLYRDVDDLFGKFNSQRQFFTMPSTTIPNKQDEFARWLYSSSTTCKENQDYCLQYEDLRAKRPVFVNPNDNPVNGRTKNAL
jgi:hypothetical protein